MSNIWSDIQHILMHMNKLEDDLIAIIYNPEPYRPHVYEHYSFFTDQDRKDHYEAWEQRQAMWRRKLEKVRTIRAIAMKLQSE